MNIDNFHILETHHVILSSSLDLNQPLEFAHIQKQMEEAGRERLPLLLSAFNKAKKKTK